MVTKSTIPQHKRLAMGSKVTGMKHGGYTKAARYAEGGSVGGGVPRPLAPGVKEKEPVGAIMRPADDEGPRRRKTAGDGDASPPMAPKSARDMSPPMAPKGVRDRMAPRAPSMTAEYTPAQQRRDEMRQKRAALRQTDAPREKPLGPGRTPMVSENDDAELNRPSAPMKTKREVMRPRAPSKGSLPPGAPSLADLAKYGTAVDPVKPGRYKKGGCVTTSEFKAHKMKPAAKAHGSKGIGKK